MNLVENLLQIDDDKINEQNTAVFKSKRLQKMLGAEDPVDIELKEAPYRRISDIMSAAYNGKGKTDSSKLVTAQIRIILISVTNIDFKNDELQKKFGAATPADLVEKMLNSEIGAIWDTAVKLSGYADDEETEKEEIEEIKN